MQDRLSPILAPNGSPFERVNGHSVDRLALDSSAVRKSLLGTFNHYLESLIAARRPARAQATQPFERHAWVFAAAMAQAKMASQAPFRVYVETPDELRRRETRAKALGRGFRPRCGERRTAFARHLAGHGVTLRRLAMKGAEIDWDHPIADLFANPNPLQNGSQLLQLTHLWMAVRGECFWVLTNEAGERPMPGELPARIWPVTPDAFCERLARGRRGELVGWELRPPVWMPQSDRVRINLDLDEVIHFKDPDPNNPVRGLSRISAAAAAIDLDFAMRAHARNLMKNSGKPDGLLKYAESLDKDDEDDLRTRWEDQHAGEDNAGRLAILSGGLEYQQISFSQKDLLFLDQAGWNRDEVLAVMNTPRAVLGITEGVNYATALAQIRVCWDQAVLPILRTEEETLDATLFFDSPDDTFGAFDLMQVDALRVGVQEKIEAAERLAGSELHLPPRTAFDVVGIDVPDYEGDDVAVVPPALVPLGAVLDGSTLPAIGNGGGQAAGGEALAASPPQASDALEAPAIRTREPLDKHKRHRALVKLASPFELTMRRRYRRWVIAERTATLERFDELASRARARAKASGRFTRELDLEELEVILPDLAVSAQSLGSLVRPTMAGALEMVFDFTADGTEIGIPTFEIDDSRFIRYFDLRESLFRERVSGSVYDRLRESLTAGIQSGETVQQLRARIGESYGLAASPHKTLLVARTETSGFVSGIRQEMFEAQGIEQVDWTSMPDEARREDHGTFDGLGAQDLGTNWLALIDKPGTLRHPGDHLGPVEQVANCRCAHVAVIDD